MEITKREILVSVTIVAVMMILGFVIAGRLDAYQIEKNQEYYTALQITDPDLFKYGMDTSVGHAFVYGTLQAVDPVTYPDIGGSYLYVKKEEEHYNRHTRPVTKKDSDGNEYTSWEEYWTWDYEWDESIHSQKIRFLSMKMDYGKIQMPASQYLDTVYKSRHVRFNYYIVPAECEGTIYTDLKDGTVSDDSEFLINTDIQHAVEMKTYSTTWLFWVFWLAFTGFCVYSFCYLDNDWLNLDD